MPDATSGRAGSLLIRDARAEEQDEVAQLLRDAFRQYARFIPRASWKAYLADVIDVRGRFDVAELLVAELDGQLAGTVTLYLDAARSADTGWPEGWAGVRLLGVHPRYRGRGIGQALMDECLRRCRERSIKTIGLHTSELMDVARRMYETMGFRRAPEFDFHPAPGVVVMAYRLDLEPATTS